MAGQGRKEDSMAKDPTAKRLERTWRDQEMVSWASDTRTEGQGWGQARVSVPLNPELSGS